MDFSMVCFFPPAPVSFCGAVVHIVNSVVCRVQSSQSPSASLPALEHGTAG